MRLILSSPEELPLTRAMARYLSNTWRGGGERSNGIQTPPKPGQMSTCTPSPERKYQTSSPPTTTATTTTTSTTKTNGNNNRGDSDKCNDDDDNNNAYISRGEGLDGLPERERPLRLGGVLRHLP